jgi:5-formyltetrahydrofolate cyclo-ligase
VGVTHQLDPAYMLMTDISEIKNRKASLRAEAQRRRVAQPDKDRLSGVICVEIAASGEFLAARTVLLYIHYASEVRTDALVAAALAGGKTVAVPYCVGDELRLFRLRSTDELAPGAYDILEPRPALRDVADRRILPTELDLAIVPGVAFDRACRRLGHGKGYYDRLLAHVRPQTLLVAPAFDCQVFDEIPTLLHDVPMHRVVTETSLYERGLGIMD